METETKKCGGCQKDFVIRSEDGDFYNKIKVPSPTKCPECRFRRRLAFRNERNFYKRKCNLCQKDVISMYSADVPFPVYCQPCWWSDKWQAPELSYDPSRSFMEQFRELRDKTPHEATQASQSVDSEYANFVESTKNGYLSSGVFNCRDIFYSRFVTKCTDSIECGYASNLDKCVRMTYVADAYMSRDSINIESSRNIAFCSQCTNISDCYGCINLRHKKYCIFNEQYSKEDYIAKVKELGSLSQEEQGRMVREFWLKNPVRGNNVFSSSNCSGTEIYYSSNCKDSFFTNYVRDGAYLFEASSGSKSAETTHDIWDCSVVTDCRVSYEMIGGNRSSECMFGFLNDDSLNCRYSMFLYGCSNNFGCVGLRNKEHRILNKEYSKEEYETLVKQIVADMKEYGEFFPVELSPFAYNETIGQNFLPLSKENALVAGFRWREADRPSYPISVMGNKLPSVQEVTDDVLKEIIGCVHAGACEHNCTKAFKMVSQELLILKQVGAVLPELCPNCRLAEQIPVKSFKLYDRKCRCSGKTSDNGVYVNFNEHLHGGSPCGNRFSSLFAPESPEIVYCESCHNGEVG